MSGATALRGWPSLSPQKGRSSDSATKPCSAILVAYRLALCSLTAPMGWPTRMAGFFLLRSRFLGTNRLPATAMRYWFLKVTLRTATLSLWEKLSAPLSLQGAGCGPAAIALPPAADSPPHTAAPKPARMRKSRRSEVRGDVPGIGCCAWMVESVLCMFDAPGEVGNWERTRNREMKAGAEGAPSLDAPMLCPRVNRWRVRYAPSKAPGAATRAGPCPLCPAAPGRVHRRHRPRKSPDCPRARSS